MRGAAALCVVFWHWRHLFGIPKHELTPFVSSDSPLYLFFKILYDNGFWAVEMFFCLSGFVFFWLYSDRIGQRKISLKEFVVLRFSRLYPLHFLTLLFVAAGQMYMHWRYGSYFIYQNNDLQHFGLQLLLASSWGLASGDSFNGPIWSVSVETLCYAAFFVICLLNCRRWWHLMFIVGASCILERLGHAVVIRGIFCFFLGGLSFQAFHYVWQRSFSRHATMLFAVITLILWVLALINLYSDLLPRMLDQIFSIHGTFVSGLKGTVGFLFREISRLYFEAILCPLTILTLALVEAHRGTLGRRLAFLGDISYSTYLLHFPLQLGFALVVSAFAVPVGFFCSPWALFLFFFILITVSLCSYHFFERPCQSWLRSKLLARTRPH